uniref:Uncharacterized protein n=1 Tax=Acrobeloides nanus TaxID=290746 RepID=A0A914D8P7_9BILA
MGIFDKSLCQFCLCGRKKNSPNAPKEAQDDDDAYGTIGPIDTDLPKSGHRVTFRLGKNDKNSNNTSTRLSNDVTSHNTKKTAKSSIFGSCKPQKNRPSRELPQLPGKKIPFSRSNIPNIDESSNPTYECIDAENDSISDPVYSKVDENPSTQRYDYPIFSRGKKKKVVEEPLYTSASQIYSGGSEDPYSSIISEGYKGVNDDNYDPGYARVKEPHNDSSNQPSTSRNTPPNLDQLYAKINRPSLKKARPLQNGTIPPSTENLPSTSTASKPSETYNREIPITRPFHENTSFYQLDESGSGSISGSSQNPSYRYLTVRETVDVIRERLRRRQQGLPDLPIDTTNMVPIREHYYSTIQNEYESVGGGSMTDSIYGTAITTADVPSASNYRSIHRNSPLTLNVTRLYPSSSPTDQMPPKPPTSPIPSRTLTTTTHTPTTSILRPTVVSPAPVIRLPPLPEMSTSMIEKRISYTEVEERSNSNPNLAGNQAAYEARSRSMAQLPYSGVMTIGHAPPGSSRMHPSTLIQGRTSPGFGNTTISSVYPRGTPRIISSISTIFPSEKRWRENYPIGSRKSAPVENGYATLSRNASTDTNEFPLHTHDMETQTHSSRIPVPISARQRERSRSPSADASTQTNGLGEEDRKKGPPPLPTPSGRDYVSPVDLGSKRAWPLASKAENGTQTK